MSYWVIRHKKTGEIMPQSKSGAGYSYWEPGEKGSGFLYEIPRLFTSRQAARAAAKFWSKGTAYKKGGHLVQDPSSFGLDISPVVIQYKDAGRKARDLEVLEIELTVNASME